MSIDDSQLASVVSSVRLKLTRTRILKFLELSYPKEIEEAVLRLSIFPEEAVGYITRELHYLAEKGLVHISESRFRVTSVVITARGRDFLMGDVREVGLSSPEEY